MIVDISQLGPAERQQWLQHSVAPRPIALASTIDRSGHVNLAPFSFFNLFSTRPPIVIFSPSRRVRNNTIKHSLENVREVPEVVINIVDADIVQQTNLASCDYPKEVNEFQKAGFSEEKARYIRPPMVKESKINMECRVLEIKSLGESGGAGNLVIAEVICLHVLDSILNEDKTMIDQRKIHHVARLGANWYSRVEESNLFEVEKPHVLLGIGFDALPANIRSSSWLTGNHLGQLANVHEMPEIDPGFDDPHLRQIIQYYSINPQELENELHRYAKTLLDQGKVREAWQVLLTQ